MSRQRKESKGIQNTKNNIAKGKQALAVVYKQTSSPINLHANKHLQIYFIYVSVSLNACLCTIFMSDPYNIEIVYWIFQNSSNS